MEEIKLQLNSREFDDLVLALSEAKNIHEVTDQGAKAAVYSNLLTVVLVQRALQDYALIQSQEILNPTK